MVSSTLQRVDVNRMQPDAGHIDPTLQRWTVEVRNLNVEPSKKLMLAVLQDAVMVLLDPSPRRSLPEQRIRTDAERWVASNDSIHPFAFCSICEALGIDPQYLRRAIRTWRGSHEDC